VNSLRVCTGHMTAHYDCEPFGTWAQTRTSSESCRYEGCLPIPTVVRAAIAVPTMYLISVLLVMVGVLRTDTLAKELQTLVLHFVPCVKQKLLEDTRLPDNVWDVGVDEVACPL
jgi:hypothetical protein